MDEAKLEVSPPVHVERGIRDLMGLLSLSALWLGKDGFSVLEQMLEAVERIVPIQFAYAEASILPIEPLTARARIQGHRLTEEAIGPWKGFANDWLGSVRAAGLTSAVFQTPIGELKVVRIELGISTFDGGVWFGSKEPEFPTTTQLAIFRAASSLAVTAIQAAKIQFERDESHRAKDEFLAMLGHELRNPLAPIRAGASLLLRDGVSAAQVKKTATIIERQVGHMTGLVDSLLDVSRLSTGAVMLAEEVLDLKEVFEDALEQIAPLFAAKSHAVEVNIAVGAGHVYGDRNRLVQVLANLFNNAAKYTPEGGRIVLSLSERGSQIVVSVADNGIGIEPEMLLRVFQLFAQARRSADRFGGGLGLGLALAKKLVDLHKGQLSAKSEGLGKGATFELSLTRVVVPTEPAHEFPHMTAPSTFRPLKIFIVDDNCDAADTLAEMMQMFGHSVHVENHPIIALARAPEVKPDVFLLDIGLPEIDGYELARRLRANADLKPCTLVALTGYGQPSDLEKAYDAGFNFHCVKPIDLDNLNSILSEVAVQRYAPRARDQSQ